MSKDEDGKIQTGDTDYVGTHKAIEKCLKSGRTKAIGIYITQYSPFGNQNEIYDDGKDMGKLMDDPVLVEIGKKYCKTSDIRSFRRASSSLARGKPRRRL